MRNICVFIKWVSCGKICFGWCREHVCEEKDNKCTCK